MSIVELAKLTASVSWWLMLASFWILVAVFFCGAIRNEITRWR
jgi:hypothetical protein